LRAAQKLWTYGGSKNAAKALIAAEYNGVKITCPPFEMGVTNKDEKFLKLNPLGKARLRTAAARSMLACDAPPTSRAACRAP
jgi:hypothetical protein